MITCPFCNVENPLNLTICQSCQHPLPSTTDYFHLPPGAHFKYQIIRLLGKGAMGTTYLVSQEGRYYALKLIKGVFFEDKKILFDALRNYQNQSSSSYEILDYGEVSDGYYVVSTYVKGETLTQIIANQDQREEQFGFKSVCSIIFQLIKVLKQLHPRQAHTFINPNTIIIAPEGDVALIDYAIYINMGPSSRFRAATENDYADFIAPDLNVRDGDHLYRSDIYSLGVLFYYLLTRSYPQEHLQLRNIPSINSPDRLYKMLSMMINPDPELRFETVNQIEFQLKQLVGQVPPMTPPPTKTPPPKGPGPQKKVLTSIKDKKLTLPKKKDIVSEFNDLKVNKGDVTLGELDDVERWLFVKDGADIGPVSAKTIRDLVEGGELDGESILKTLTNPPQKSALKDFDLFNNFLKDYSLRKGEVQFQKEIKKGKRTKTMIAIGIVILIAGIAAAVFFSGGKKKDRYVRKKRDQSTIIESLGQDEVITKNSQKKKRTRRRGDRKGKKSVKIAKIEKKVNGLTKKEHKELTYLKGINRTKNTDVTDIAFDKKSGKVGLSNEQILKGVNRYRKRIIGCFQKEFSRTNYLPPSVEIFYDIRTNGRLYNVTINHKRYKHKKDPLNLCVLRVFRKIKFKPFSGGTKSGSLPFDFNF